MSRQKRTVFDELIAEVRRSQVATARFDQAVASAIGINHTDMACLDVLQREGPLTAGQLAERTGLTSGSMTTALDRLERSGYAQRVRDATDRRRVLVQLTDKADGISEYYRGQMELSDELYRRYTGEQLELLLTFFRAGREVNEREAARIEQREQSGHHKRHKPSERP